MGKKVSDFVNEIDKQNVFKCATGDRTELFEIIMDSGSKCYVDHITMKAIQKNIPLANPEDFACVMTYHFDTPTHTASLYYNPVYMMYYHISSWRAFQSVTIVREDNDDYEGKEDGERL